MLGGAAASKFSYIRPVSGPENTSNIGENPNINNSVPLTLTALADFLSSDDLWRTFGSDKQPQKMF